jgi:L-lysine exporter family protein LysE/ArgO
MIFPLLLGFATGMTLIVAIGAQNAFVLRQGIRREHVLAVVTVCAGSDLALIAAGVAGVGALITSHPDAITATKFGGAAFLFGYGVLAARRTCSPAAMKPSDAGPARLISVVLTCLALTWLNPHVYLDTVVLIGTLANQHHDGRWLFGVGAAAASTLWFTTLGFGAHRLHKLFTKPAAWRVLDGLIAITMVSLSVALVAGSVPRP